MLNLESFEKWDKWNSILSQKDWATSFLRVVLVDKVYEKRECIPSLAVTSLILGYVRIKNINYSQLYIIIFLV